MTFRMNRKPFLCKRWCWAKFAFFGRRTVRHVIRRLTLLVIFIVLSLALINLTCWMALLGVRARRSRGFLRRCFMYVRVRLSNRRRGYRRCVLGANFTCLLSRCVGVWSRTIGLRRCIPLSRILLTRRRILMLLGTCRVLNGLLFIRSPAPLRLVTTWLVVLNRSRVRCRSFGTRRVRRVW